MKKTLLKLAVIFFSVGILLSGMQTITGYYADPSGYGYHHIASAYLNVSIAITLIFGIVLINLMKKIEKHMW